MIPSILGGWRHGARRARRQARTGLRARDRTTALRAAFRATRARHRRALLSGAAGPSSPVRGDAISRLARSDARETPHSLAAPAYRGSIIGCSSCPGSGPQVARHAGLLQGAVVTSGLRSATGHLLLVTLRAATPGRHRHPAPCRVLVPVSEPGHAAGVWAGAGVRAGWCWRASRRVMTVTIAQMTIAA
jgi:hypothetical protein